MQNSSPIAKKKKKSSSISVRSLISIKFCQYCLFYELGFRRQEDAMGEDSLVINYVADNRSFKFKVIACTEKGAGPINTSWQGGHNAAS